MSSFEQTIDWQGITLSVTVTPPTEGERHSKLELQTLKPRHHPLPVSFGDYHWRWVEHELEDFGGPVAYVQALLDFEARRPAWQRLLAHVAMHRIY